MKLQFSSIESITMNKEDSERILAGIIELPDARENRLMAEGLNHADVDKAITVSVKLTPTGEQVVSSFMKLGSHRLGTAGVFNADFVIDCPASSAHHVMRKLKARNMARMSDK